MNILRFLDCKAAFVNRKNIGASFMAVNFVFVFYTDKRSINISCFWGDKRSI